MKKKQKPQVFRAKPAETAPKAARSAPNIQRPAIACGSCATTVADPCGRGVYCRSLISDRAGFLQSVKATCAYGRAGELVGA